MISLRADGKTHKFYIHRLASHIQWTHQMACAYCTDQVMINQMRRCRIYDSCISENMMDKYDGTSNRGERCAKAKLTEVQVKYIKARLRDGVGHSVLAHLFEVTRESISKINTGRNWSHI